MVRSRPLLARCTALCAVRCQAVRDSPWLLDNGGRGDCCAHGSPSWRTQVVDSGCRGCTCNCCGGAHRPVPLRQRGARTRLFDGLRAARDERLPLGMERLVERVRREVHLDVLEHLGVVVLELLDSGLPHRQCLQDSDGLRGRVDQVRLRQVLGAGFGPIGGRELVRVDRDVEEVLLLVLLEERAGRLHTGSAQRSPSRCARRLWWPSGGSACRRSTSPPRGQLAVGTTQPIRPQHSCFGPSGVTRVRLGRGSPTGGPVGRGRDCSLGEGAV